MTKSVNDYIAGTLLLRGQLALQDTWDDGRGNSTTTTRVVQVRDADQMGNVVVLLEDGSLAIVGVNTLRNLPAIFAEATF